MFRFAEAHKARAFCNHLLSHGGPHFRGTNKSMENVASCCQEKAAMDAHHIFQRQNQDVVYELISYYAESLTPTERAVFIIAFDDLSNQYGLNILVTDNGLILRQEQKIIEEIYTPTLNYLSDPKWKDVNSELSDAFSDYLKNTPDGYSSCVTHTVTALQAFLQITVNGETGKGDIALLLKKALADGFIPNDPFSTKILKDAVSILMEERQTKGDPHPKKEYANEKTARTLLNLTMVFFQHCLQ